MKFAISNNVEIISIGQEGRSDCDNLLYSFETAKMLRLSKEYTNCLHHLDFEKLPVELMEILIKGGFLTYQDDIKQKASKGIYSVCLFGTTGRCYFGETPMKGSDIVLDFCITEDVKFNTAMIEGFPNKSLYLTFKKIVNRNRGLN